MKSIHYSVNNKVVEDITDVCKMIDQIYKNESCIEDARIKSLIKKKLSGYKGQDMRQNIYSDYHTIKLDEVICKLHECNMQCHYCKKSMKLLYSMIRDPLQWTLDRINNLEGHNSKNVVISCLKCNLSRRNINLEKFLFTKQLRIEKI